MQRLARSLALLTVMLVCCQQICLADGPADNQAETVRRIPKLGVELPEDDNKQLTAGLQSLTAKIEKLRALKSEQVDRLLPDILVFHRAVDQALRYQEFFDLKEVPSAKLLLMHGHLRAEQLLNGYTPWVRQTGPVVRGYISKIDGTVQPYGMVIPPTYVPDGTERHRLDFWFHGRGEQLSELNFVTDRSKNPGQITPENTIVVHPYGRYCNANKLAGEIDTLEVLDAVQQQYRIDPDRISVRGFSMGGAACWQFAVHYPDRWFAANPGAGFSETPEFLKFFQKETLNPTAYEAKLWRQYDCPGYAANLFHLPTIAYSGDMDIQKQAADIMATAFEREQMTLLHIIGPMTGHKIHPNSAAIIEAKLAEWAKQGINREPQKLQFVTYTLKYNRMHWLTVDGMKDHWEEARVQIEPANDVLVIKTRNVSGLTIRPPASLPRQVRIDDGPRIPLPENGSFIWDAAGWHAGMLSGLRKKHQLQGPVDDALMDSFIFVKPSHPCRNPAIDKWVQEELDRAITQWRRQMRGDAIVKADNEITEQDWKTSNLILWGDSQANSVTAKVVGQLPIQWTAEKVVVGQSEFESENHVPIVVYPNPLNPEKYVVLNSSFTYREYDYLNNARQVPKLPDWAVIDVRTAPNSRYPGKIVDADFFDEQWKLKAR